MNSIAKSFLQKSIQKSSSSSSRLLRCKFYSTRNFSSSTASTLTTDTGTKTSTDTKSNNEINFINDKPTLAYAKRMPQRYSSMKHEQILQLCVEGSTPARREALIRNIMAVDSIEYTNAATKVRQMSIDNRSAMILEYSPYHIGMGAALAGGAISFPLVFDKNAVMWFNETFVTAEVPPVEDLETMWEVGSWSWGWMEPVIGQASFVLLLLQFARSQAVKLGVKPYGDYMLHMRSKRLVEAYPQYNPMFLEWFAQSEELYGSNLQE